MNATTNTNHDLTDILNPTAHQSARNSGADVLDQVTTFIRRFSAFPSRHCAPTLALWYAHTHIADQLYVTPG